MFFARPGRTTTRTGAWATTGRGSLATPSWSWCSASRSPTSSRTPSCSSSSPTSSSCASTCPDRRNFPARGPEIYRCLKNTWATAVDLQTKRPRFQEYRQSCCVNTVTRLSSKHGVQIQWHCCRAGVPRQSHSFPGTLRRRPASSSSPARATWSSRWPSPSSSWCATSPTGPRSACGGPEGRLRSVAESFGMS